MKYESDFDRSLADSCDDSSSRVTVKSNSTARACDNRISISLINTATQGNPAHKTVYATLGSDSGEPQKQLRGVDVGYSCIFEGFRVQIESIGVSEAVFSVIHLPATATPRPTPRITRKG
ncbi:hypothetical protein IAD21_00732 [Abditibacteriota bacterium]|nr:hypothetical protein IAD21_00732 [Abditibacteriota bacterium]